MDVRSERTFVQWQSFLGFLAFLSLIGAWLVSSETAIGAAKASLSLCGEVLIPALFPFFVLSQLFIRRGYDRYLTALLRPVMGPVFGLPAEGAGALVLGSVGGYPVGASAAFALYDRSLLTAGETARLLAFCNNAGPSFVFGVVGAGLFHSTAIGARLLLVHLLAALAAGSALRFLPAAQPPFPSPPRSSAPAAAREAEPFTQSLVAAVSAALGSILSVCAYVTFFGVLVAFARQSGVFLLPAVWLGRLFSVGSGAGGALLTGAAELSSGIAALGSVSCPVPALLSAASFLLGWGGACVHCQVLALRGLRPVSLKPYLLGKLTQGVLAAVLIQLSSHFRLSAVVFLAAAATALPAVPGLFKNRSGKIRERGI